MISRSDRRETATTTITTTSVLPPIYESDLQLQKKVDQREGASAPISNQLSVRKINHSLHSPSFASSSNLAKYVPNTRNKFSQITSLPRPQIRKKGASQHTRQIHSAQKNKNVSSLRERKQQVKIGDMSSNLDLSRKVYHQILLSTGPITGQEIPKTSSGKNQRRCSIVNGDRGSSDKSRVKATRHSQTASSGFKNQSISQAGFAFKQRMPSTPNSFVRKTPAFLSSIGFETTIRQNQKRSKGGKKL